MTVDYEHIRLKPDDTLAEDLCKGSLEDDLVEASIPEETGGSEDLTAERRSIMD